MQVRRCRDADEFLRLAGDFLSAREAEHNLILGLCAGLRGDPLMYGEAPYFAVAQESDLVVAAAMRTPPHNLILSEVDDEAALGPLAEDALETFPTLPGVLGPTVAAERFVSLWQEATGARGRRAIAQRLFRTENVTPPAGVPGRMRDYETGDRELALRWLEAFADEALPEPPPVSNEEFLAHKSADPEGGIVLWEDGEPVSIAGYGGPTPNGIRIGPVYTPPELRRRGYASALTAELTQSLLDRGRRFCFLFTDLANPTSNNIYQAVGYRPVSDFDMWAFDS
ncbi:MAG: GNAT family N-acetyltransferase [Gaiellaceae bacterium]